MGQLGWSCRIEPCSMNYKTSFLLSLLLATLVLLLQPEQSSSAPVPRPAPAPFTPGIKIGALLGAGLVLKAYLLSQALAGESEPDSSYGAPSSSYGAPSSSYGAPSSSYGVPSYKPSYNG